MAGKSLNLKGKWDSLAPKRRQQLALVGGLAGVGLVSWVMLAGAGPAKKDVDLQALDAKVANSLLPTEDTRDIGMSGITKDVEQERTSRMNLEERVSRTEEMLKEQSRQAQEGGANKTQNDQLREELESVKGELAQLKSSGIPAQSAPVGPLTAAPAEAPGYGGIRTISNSAADGAQATDASYSDDSSAGDVDGDSGSKKQAAAPAPSKMYLPSGSIIEGVMLTGLDAPTGKGALKDPVPVLVRIQKDAVLPNRYRADIKECFALVAGQGDLASERAYLRSETISCVRNDKGVIDLNMKSYVVDTDGKAGLRGRLVSKQGSVVGKAIIASFADGVSQAFKGSSPQLRLDGSSDINYGQSLNNGALMGASSSLDRISKYYLDLADQMFPILEIDAGRHVTLVLVKGLEMSTVR